MAKYGPPDVEPIVQGLLPDRIACPVRVPPIIAMPFCIRYIAWRFPSAPMLVQPLGDAEIAVGDCTHARSRSFGWLVIIDRAVGLSIGAILVVPSDAWP